MKTQNSDNRVEAVTRLFLQHREMLAAYVYTMVRDHHRTEDILQETAITLVRRASEFGDIQHFWPLAREISRRHALAVLRRDTKPQVLLSEEAMEALDRAFEGVGHESFWDIDILKHCIANLPNSWQTIVRLRFWMQMSVQNIGQKLGRSANAISVSLNRARLRLAECMVQRHEMGERL